MAADNSTKNFFLILFSSFLIFLNSNSVAQSAEQNEYYHSTLPDSTINKSDWQEQKENYEYVKDGQKKTEKKEEEKINEEDSARKKKKNSWSLNLDTATARAILVSIVVGILVLLVVLLIRRSNWVFNKKVNEKNLLIERLEENLPESDIDPHLQKAINEKDFRLAFRLYFLLLIQQLAQSGQVIWRKEKTNGEYLAQCVSKNYFQTFSFLTLAFDRVWYGNYLISEKEFSEYRVQFQSILHQLKQPQ